MQEGYAHKAACIYLNKCILHMFAAIKVDLKPMQLAFPGTQSSGLLRPHRHLNTQCIRNGSHLFPIPCVPGVHLEGLLLNVMLLQAQAHTEQTGPIVLCMSYQS